MKGVAIRSIATSGTATPFLALRQWRSSFTGGDVAQIRFDGLTTTSGYAEFASIYASAGTNTASGAPTSLAFNTMNTSFVSGERMRISANGDVGIGTTNPTGRLGVAVTGSRTIGTAWDASSVLVGSPGQFSGNLGLSFDTTNGATLESAAPGVASYPIRVVGLQAQFFTAGSERMRIDSSGNLLVGTTTASAPFVVQRGTAYVDANIAKLGDSVLGRYLRIHNVTGGGNTRTALSAQFDGSDTNYFDLLLNPFGGNVGIGTSSPATRLQVSGGVTASENFFAATGGVWFTAANTFTRGIAQAGSDVAFYTVGAERMRITDGGNVGIGTSTATRRLEVVGGTLTAGTQSSYAVGIANSGGSNGDLTFGSDGSFAYVQSWAGKALIINGQGNEVRIAGATDQGAFNLQVNGTGVWGAGAYVNGSDRNLKEEIAPLADALDVVAALKPVTFRYKEEYSKDQSIQPGFIAQELQEALVDQVYLDGIVQAGPEHLNVAYQSLIPVLVKAIQELTARVAQLEGN